MKRKAAQEETTPLNALPLKNENFGIIGVLQKLKVRIILSGCQCIIHCIHHTAGKEALSLNPGQFNRVASKAFRDTNEEERMELETQLLEPSRMTKGEVNKRAAAIFRKIQKSIE